MIQMINAIYSHFPKGTDVMLPQGGGLLWVRLPQSMDLGLLTEQALHKKISIAPGKLFSTTQNVRTLWCPI